MDNSRELANLPRRANRLTLLQAPPALSMLIVQPGDELPPPSTWRLTVVIEPKRAARKTRTNRVSVCVPPTQKFCQSVGTSSLPVLANGKRKAFRSK